MPKNNKPSTFVNKGLGNALKPRTSSLNDSPKSLSIPNAPISKNSG